MDHAYSLWDTLGDNGNRPNLRVLHELHGGLVHTARRSKVDNGIDVRVLGHRLLYALVNWQKGLAGSPVHLADELSTKGIDDARNGRCGALADEVEIEHALHGSWLETVHEASCLVVEESMLCARAQRPAGSNEASDVVVGIASTAGRGRQSTSTVCATWDCGRHDGWFGVLDELRVRKADNGWLWEWERDRGGLWEGGKGGWFQVLTRNGWGKELQQ